MMRPVLMALAGMAMSGAAQAGMYKCTDSSGSVTFSQVQCAADATPHDVIVSRPSEAAAQESREKWEAIGAQQDEARLQRDLARAEARQRELFAIEQAAQQRQQDEADKQKRRDSRDGGYRYEFGWSNSHHPYRDYRDNAANQKGQSQRGKDRIHGAGAVRPSLPSVTGGR